jgi:hypothetical protein
MGFFATIYYLWGFVNCIHTFINLFKGKEFLNLRLTNPDAFKVKASKVMLGYMSVYAWLFLGILTTNWLWSIIFLVVFFMFVRISNWIKIDATQRQNIFGRSYLFMIRFVYFLSVIVPVINGFHLHYNISQFIIGLF